MRPARAAGSTRVGAIAALLCPACVATDGPARPAAAAFAERVVVRGEC